MLDYPPENCRNYCHFNKKENPTVYRKKTYSELKRHTDSSRPTQREGEINEYDVAFYLVIVVILRLLLGAAETLTTEH